MQTNYIIDILFNRGVLVSSEVVGIYYLIKAVEPFNLGKALIGFALVLTGVIFEYLVTLAKVDFKKEIIAYDKQRIKENTEDAMKDFDIFTGKKKNS
ncbi:MAG: hypothetical protein WA666_07525 [Nitrospirota bacterium]